MHETTSKWILKRAAESGVSEDKLCLNPEDDFFYDVYIIFGGAEDEVFHLGNTLYAVNIADWLGEQCAIESAIQGGEDWVIEIYAAERFEGDSPIYRVTRDEVPDATCGWNSGGDPASGCDDFVSGIDGLCDKHRKAVRDLERAAVA